MEVMAQCLGEIFTKYKEDYNNRLRDIRTQQVLADMRKFLDDDTLFAESGKLLDSVKSDTVQQNLYTELLGMAQAEFKKRAEAVGVQLQRQTVSSEERAQLNKPFSVLLALTDVLSRFLEQKIFDESYSKIFDKVRAKFVAIEANANLSATQRNYADVEDQVKAHKELTQYFSTVLRSYAQQLAQFNTALIQELAKKLSEKESLTQALESVHAAVPLLRQLQAALALPNTYFKLQYEEKFGWLKGQYLEKLRQKAVIVQRLAGERKADEAESQLRALKTECA